MKDMVDLYAKLVIGTFTFIGPSITLLISVFASALQKLNQERLENIQNMGFTDLSAIEALIVRGKKDDNMLKPSIRAGWIFGTLLGAIILIEFFYFQHTHFGLDLKLGVKLSQILRISTIGLSVLLFIYSLYALWHVLSVTVRLKSEEKKEDTKKTLKTVN